MNCAGRGAVGRFERNGVTLDLDVFVEAFVPWQQKDQKSAAATHLERSNTGRKMMNEAFSSFVDKHAEIVQYLPGVEMRGNAQHSTQTFRASAQLILP